MRMVAGVAKKSGNHHGSLVSLTVPDSNQASGIGGSIGETTNRTAVRARLFGHLKISQTMLKKLLIRTIY